MKNEKKHAAIPLIARLLNPSRECYKGASEMSQRSIINIACILVFSALVCGAILAASICKFCFDGDYRLMVVFLPICFVFYFLLDRAIVFGSFRKISAQSRFIRIVIAIIFGLFNSILVDSNYFKNDIIAASAGMHDNKVNVILTGYKSQDSLASAHKHTILLEIDAIDKKISAKRDSLNAEAQGTGGSKQRGMLGIWEGMHKNYLADSVDAARLIATKMAEIGKIEESLVRARQDRDAAIGHVDATISNGINSEMDLLYKFIFKDGKFTNIAMWVLLLLLSMVLELAPLIAKGYYSTAEYFQRAEDFTELKDEAARLRKSVESKIMALESLFSAKLAEQRMTHRTELDAMREGLAHMLERITETERHVRSLNDESIRLKKKYPALYEKYFLPIINEAYSKLSAQVN